MESIHISKEQCIKMQNVQNDPQVLNPLKVKVKDFSVAKQKRITGVV